METDVLPTASPVLGTARDAFLEKMLGKHALDFEMNCYGLLSAQTKEYGGGFWDFFNLSNGGFYMAPAGYEVGFDLTVPGNGYRGHLSRDAGGIVASLYALNGLCWRVPSEAHNTLYYALREYACHHPEAAEILEAID